MSIISLVHVCDVCRSVCQSGGYNVDVYVPPPATLTYDTLLTLVMAQWLIVM